MAGLEGNASRAGENGGGGGAGGVYPVLEESAVELGRGGRGGC